MVSAIRGGLRDAVIARLLAELAFFGEFAPQKILLEKYGIKEVTA